MAQQMSLYFQPSRHFCNLEASYPANNRHLRYVKWKLQSSSSFAWPLLSHVLGRCRRVVSMFTKFGPLPSLSRKSGRVSKAVLYEGGGVGGEDAGTWSANPTSQAKQNQTGSASLWSFPFCQTFQRMGDLLEKLNADFREWDNWIQVVHLVGYKVPVPCYEY